MKVIATVLAASTLFLATPASAQGLESLKQIDTLRMFHVNGIVEKLKSQGYGRPATHIWEFDWSAFISSNKGLSSLSKLSFSGL